MILRYGNYSHAMHEAAIAIQGESLLRQSGQRYATRERWTISGELHADTQAALTTAIQTLQSAYASGGKDLVLLLDDGVTETAHKLKTSETIGGVRIVSGPSFPIGTGAEYSTYRRFEIVVEADKATSDAAVAILEWNETIEFIGGGPEVIFLQPVNGFPVPQLIRQNTSYRVVQQGTAVGYLAYPSPAAPIWPAAEHRHLRSVRLVGPRRSGEAGQEFFTEFGVNWAYFFESVGPLIGFPTVQLG